jgi:hypothetical protein
VSVVAAMAARTVVAAMAWAVAALDGAGATVAAVTVMTRVPPVVGLEPDAGGAAAIDGDSAPDEWQAPCGPGEGASDREDGDQQEDQDDPQRFHRRQWTAREHGLRRDRLAAV